MIWDHPQQTSYSAGFGQGAVKRWGDEVLLHAASWQVYQLSSAFNPSPVRNVKPSACLLLGPPFSQRSQQQPTCLCTNAFNPSPVRNVKPSACLLLGPPFSQRSQQQPTCLCTNAFNPSPVRNVKPSACLLLGPPFSQRSQQQPTCLCTNAFNPSPVELRGIKPEPEPSFGSTQLELDSTGRGVLLAATMTPRHSDSGSVTPLPKELHNGDPNVDS
ncbi:hypothetical protein BDK51DRAFT_43001 [Blyttiomyces helicus]|uniref:Uncharacterized protein n=1 Tax=Blyttiomyces helicus TaxID=388810 RepID=A0A4P9WPJ1_9FUNG|nr:hypothetical protein BDK51DRAFT_43001 [Blyttiomyces helicus]|eukprot:RKO92726.1 hypothetical protein BDK51DRAFT_43001 [Blyttiomyces helicus]